MGLPWLRQRNQPARPQLCFIHEQNQHDCRILPSLLSQKQLRTRRPRKRPRMLLWQCAPKLRRNRLYWLLDALLRQSIRILWRPSSHLRLQPHKLRPAIHRPSIKQLCLPRLLPRACHRPSPAWPCVREQHRHDSRELREFLRLNETASHMGGR